MTSEATPRPRLLLVEDEPLLALTLCECLENEFDIEVAGNVAEARALFGRGQFDVILSDHMLPGKQQGLDFLMEALRERPEVKRILMTGYVNPELLIRSLSLAQLSACLVKPVELSRLRQELDQALGIR